MSGNRAVRAATTSVRILTGAVIAVAVVAGAVVAVGVPWPGIVHEPAQAEVTPLPGDTVLVCNGDLRAIGRDTSDPLRMVSAATSRFTLDSTGDEPEITALSVRDLDGAGDVRRVVGDVDGRTAPLIGASESAVVTADDLAGFAALPCREAGTESWLIGGTVENGSADLIVLTNPGAVPSTVTLTAYGETRGATTTVVPAESQLAVPLASIASGSTAPVVEVSATGSPIRAVLQSSLLRTLDPVGIDLVDSVAAPQRQPVIPAVQIVQDDGDGASSAVLRLMSPDADSFATVTIREVGSAAVASTFDVELIADAPVDMGLSGLEPGMYSVQVDADAAVLAAVREQDGSGPGSDFAWATPAPEFADEVLVAVPAGPAATLYLVNDEDEDATVVVDTEGGQGPQEVTVPAGSSVSVEVASRTVHSIRTSGPVHASITMSAAGQLAAWSVSPPISADKSVVVYP